MKESTQEVGNIIQKSISEKGNNQETDIDKIKNIPQSLLLQRTLKPLAQASNPLKLNQDKEGNMSSLGVPIRSLGGDKIRVNDNIYVLTPQIHIITNILHG